MSETPKATKVSGADVISLVKESNDLLEQSLGELKSANNKIAQFNRDSSEAKPLIEQAVEKLASIKVDGTSFIDADEKQTFIDGMSTKHSVADVLNQVLDRFEKLASTSTNKKTASSLGEASDRPTPTGPPVSGFAALPGTRNVM